MPKLLKTRGRSRDGCGVPPEQVRVEIIRALLKLKHFDGVWYDGKYLSVRKFPDNAPLEHLSWGDAVKILEGAADSSATSPGS